VQDRASRRTRELRELQKEELRRERDRLVLDLSRSLGTDELARCLGTTPATTETLVQRARGRLSDSAGSVSARRMGRDPERWREADSHYEALGRNARLPFWLRGRS